MQNIRAHAVKRDYIGKIVSITQEIQEEIQNALDEVLLYTNVHESRDFTFETSDGVCWYARYRYNLENGYGAVEIENLILH